MLTQLERTQSIALASLVGVTALLKAIPQKSAVLHEFDRAAEGVVDGALATDMSDEQIEDFREVIERLRSALL